LIAAINSLIDNQPLLDEILLTSYINQLDCLKYGIFQIKLCIRGKWKIITIDELLPCNFDNQLTYASTFNNQFYVSLIEKALAKENINYQRLESGNLTEGIFEFI
jgi:calpain-15